MSPNKLKLVALLTTCVLITSCDGQKNRNQINNTTNQERSIVSNETTINNKKKEQISEVVRKMFQDSKGQIWFGTQGGAYSSWGNGLLYEANYKQTEDNKFQIYNVMAVKRNVEMSDTDLLGKFEFQIKCHMDNLIRINKWSNEFLSKNKK